MKQAEIGIILKKLSGSASFSIVGKSVGRIHLVVLNPLYARRLVPGAVISFVPRQFNGACYIAERATLDVLHLYQTLDMYWLHHLFELSHFFVPLNQPHDGLFIFLRRCIELPPRFKETPGVWLCMQRMNIGALLMLLGFFPPQPLEQKLLYFLKIMVSAESSWLEHLDAYIEELYQVSVVELDSWLVKCIHSHPNVSLFKTLDFMYNNP